MKTTLLTVLRFARRHPVILALALGVLIAGLAGPPAGASDVYGNIGPAPQLPAGGLVDRYPLVNYQLDQYFTAFSFSVLNGPDPSGVPPMIAYFIAEITWLITAFLANAVITLFAFAFNLDLLNGNGTPRSGALAPVSDAIHNLYTSTFGAPWLAAAILLAGCWAMWKALIQRRYTETAGALAISILYCVLAIGIVTQPERTIAPASQLSNELSTSILSLTSQGTLTGEQGAKSAASDQLFSLLILDPWTVLEFGGIEHCTTTSNGKTSSVAVRPLSTNPAQDTQLATQLQNGVEVHAQGKTCVNDRDKYASHFLAYPYQSSDRNAEYKALKDGKTSELPDSDPAKHNNTYSLGVVDEPAAEASGKGGQYERLLLAFVILAGELGAFLLLGGLSVGVIVAALQALFVLCLAPVALYAAIFPGRGHSFFRAWLSKLAGYLARKVIYSLILAVLLAVCQALGDATSNLGWLLAFSLQAAFLWTIFLQRNRLTADLLTATAGTNADVGRGSRLRSSYYAARFARMAGLHRRSNGRGRPDTEAPPPTPNEEPGGPPRGVDVPEPGDDISEPIAASEAPIPHLSQDPDEEPS